MQDLKMYHYIESARSLSLQGVFETILNFCDQIQFGHTKQQEHQRLAFCIPILIDTGNVISSTLDEEVPEKYCPVNLRVSEDTVAGKHIVE